MENVIEYIAQNGHKFIKCNIKVHKENGNHCCGVQYPAQETN